MAARAAVLAARGGRDEMEEAEDMIINSRSSVILELGEACGWFSLTYPQPTAKAATAVSIFSEEKERVSPALISLNVFLGK